MQIKKRVKRIFSRMIRTLDKSDIFALPDEPYSRKMGWERGTPIDRVYIDRFIMDCSEHIKGTVMEIAESTYTIKYGSNVSKSIIFTADDNQKGENVIVGDLQTGLGVREGFADCFILTQTLPFIYDLHSSIDNIIKSLKKEGTALITFRGISMISEYDEKRWGDYWGFTCQSIRKMFERKDVELVNIIQYGNVKTAVGFLYGISAEELNESDFEKNDSLYPVVIGAVVKKI